VIVISGVLGLAGVYLTCYVAYWCILLVTHLLAPARSPSLAGAGTTRFVVVIPAHNEELLLPRLLASIRDQDYPSDRFDAVVVADNCTDGTADAARRMGSIVLERVDEERRGKGYALNWALNSIDLANYDAVLVVDADCFISANALRSLDGALQQERVVQCYSGVGNPDESWFTRLLDVSRTINNDIYSSAKQRLGLSTQLIGTGMCFSSGILRKFGWDAFTVGEDCEYYAALVSNGETVGFCWDAKVLHQESSSLKQATTQRMRWSSGRFAVAWRFGFRLLRQGLLERNVVKLDAGVAFILPNPSLGMNLTLLCLAVALATLPVNGGVLAVWFFLLAMAQLGIFVLGVFYTRNRVSKFLAIFIAPAFLAWKLGIDALSVLGVGRKRWIRTERRL
jgi:cellulose synthase/poly-beta-1,6-N-acetylglucosamine synthase-like glycosyltransferase